MEHEEGTKCSVGGKWLLFKYNRDSCVQPVSPIEMSLSGLTGAEPVNLIGLCNCHFNELIDLHKDLTLSDKFKSEDLLICINFDSLKIRVFCNGREIEL